MHAWSDTPLTAPKKQLRSMISMQLRELELAFS